MQCFYRKVSFGLAVIGIFLYACSGQIIPVPADGGGDSGEQVTGDDGHAAGDYGQDDGDEVQDSGDEAVDGAIDGDGGSDGDFGKSPFLPFPQHVQYSPGCILPSLPRDTIDGQVESYYEGWKSTYLRPSRNRGYYVEYENPCRQGVTVSEAHGYGMIVVALMAGHDPDAQEIFDGLMDFYNDHRSNLNHELMDWLVDCQETPGGDDDCATDGDMDIAYALALAQRQWGGSGRYDYEAEARRIITLGIEESLVSNQTYNLLLGDWDDDPWSSRSSDWMTDHCRLFGEISGNKELWDQVVLRIYANISRIQSGHSTATGLMPDFIVGSAIDPAPANFLESEHDGEFSYNACRWPWRTALDYAHYGEPRARAALEMVVSWIEDTSGGSPSGIMAGYRLDGNAFADWNDMAFTAPFAAAAVVTGSAHQDFLDALWSAMVTTSEGYYQDTINLLCQIFISGNWWRP